MYVFSCDLRGEILKRSLLLLAVGTVFAAVASAQTVTSAPGVQAAKTPSEKSGAPAPTSEATAGRVWVNGKVYYCANDKYFGKTKHGSYMSEADAKAKGVHGIHGKTC
jgi:hypothetical protein